MSGNEISNQLFQGCLNPQGENVNISQVYVGCTGCTFNERKSDMQPNTDEVGARSKRRKGKEEWKGAKVGKSKMRKGRKKKFKRCGKKGYSRQKLGPKSTQKAMTLQATESSTSLGLQEEEFLQSTRPNPTSTCVLRPSNKDLLSTVVPGVPNTPHVLREIKGKISRCSGCSNNLKAIPIGYISDVDKNYCLGRFEEYQFFNRATQQWQTKKGNRHYHLNMICTENVSEIGVDSKSANISILELLKNRFPRAKITNC